jgi:tetratricopeptide (TPR) repeat protein
VDDLAVTHNQLGNIYYEAGNLERLLEHYNKSVQYKEMAGNIYAAGTTRCNIAIALANNGRLSDALLYARAALRNFESYGERAKDDEDKTKGVIEWIEKRMKDER